MSNQGVPDRLLKTHGSWRSENAKDGYAFGEMNKRLSISMSLGL